jgi:6-phosphofructokinase 1
MSSARKPSGFDDPIISERLFLNDMLANKQSFPMVHRLGTEVVPNPCDEKKVGKYRGDNKKCVTTNPTIMDRWTAERQSIPTFLLAGPREVLGYDPKNVKAAIVTTGGSAPGLNCVIHSIVKRHYLTYPLSHRGHIYGVQDSFLGMCDLDRYMIELKPAQTEASLEKGGSILGMRRYHDLSKKKLAEKILEQLIDQKIDILYVIGGDGSLTTAHEIAKKAINAAKNGRRKVSIIGIPKTMDNDVMWVSESFGFKTAVEKATEIINTLNSEAETSRRICLIELFGAESGYVAAHSALASGHVDLVLVPEEFLSLDKRQCEAVLNNYVEYLREKVKPRGEHAVVVLAEGTAKILQKRKVYLGEHKISADSEKGLLVQLKNHLKAQRFTDTRGDEVGVFFNRPRHYIRASPANAQDKIYCEQLGALAVDSALAGYTDCMVSQWLTSYVLVPLELVANRHKRIPASSIFWKQVLNSTGQSTIECQDYDQDESDM